MKNILKRFLIGAISCSATAFAAPTPWNGTADISWYESSAQAYNLINAEQLAGLAKLVNEGTSDFAGKTITLGADIFLNDTTGAGAGSWYNASHRGWTPIGTTSRPFKGEFDGIAGKKNRKIYGLYINNSSTNYAGLFGNASNVKISNLDIYVGRVSAKNNVGALVGYAEDGSITNVHADVKVKGNNHVGGLVGYFTGNISKSSGKGDVVGRDSVGGLAGVTTGMITGTSASKSNFIGNVEGRKFVGGVVGSGNSIQYVYSEATVKGDSNYIGGVAGFASGKVQNSYHLNGSVSGNSFVGGLVGEIQDIVSGSYSTGNVVAKGDFVGGLIGKSIYTKSSTSDVYTLRNSYVIGNVKGNDYVGGMIGFDTTSGRKNRIIMKSYSQGQVEGKSNVGGLLGKSAYLLSVNLENPTHIIDSSYHENGKVTGSSIYIGGLVGSTFGHIVNSHNSSDVEGSSYVGGIAGRTNNSGDSISNVQFVGNVFGASYIGGIVGSGVKISNSHAIGNVTGSSSTVGGVAGSARLIISAYHNGGDVVGNEYVGGLAGSVSDSVESSYSEGAVTGSKCYVGGLVGSASIIKSSYHTVGNVIGSCNVGGLAGFVKKSVENSHSAGDVSGQGSYVGGLVGNTKGLIISSHYENGNVNGDSYVGGLVGETNASVVSSYSESNVIGKGNYIGGLVGSFYRKTDTTIVSSNDSNYISDTYSIGDVNGKNYVGGLVGSFYRSVKTTGTTLEDSSYIKDSYSIGNVKGSDYVGGLIGFENVYKQLSRNKKNGIDTTYNYIYEQYIGTTVNRYSSRIKNYVINSYSKGNVEGRSNVGGLIGRQIANSDSSDKYVSEEFILLGVKNCSHREGNVLANGDYAGGFIGYSVGQIEKSYHNEGNINGLNYVGGLVGFAEAKILNSYAIGKVVKGQNSVGGLVGFTNGLVRVSYFEGDSVIGIYQIGGFAGYAKNTVDNSYSTANVKGDDNVGGLIGSAYGNISNSYATGNVIGDIEHSSAGNDNLGGLVGYQYSGSVSKSLALGDVYGTTKLGGLVGRFEGTSISQSYANGNVTGDYYGDPADEVGNYYIGGLVGYAKGSLTESYASGYVKGIEGNPVYTGCIVGYVNESLSVSKSYYDKTKCSLGVDGGEYAASVSGTPGKTTAEMQTQSTFVNWDFANTWKIEDDTYPFLQMFANSLINSVVTTELLEGIIYDGLPKTPSVSSVTLFGNALTENIDYTVKYEKNVNAGIAKISVCGINPYSGCKNVEFEIAPTSINPTISAIENITYSGVALTPSIAVYNGESLLDTSNYTVEFANNLNAGTASVTVTMKGNYVGSATATFTIEKAIPVISQNPKASDVLFGESLASSNLSGGISNVEGSFAWKTPEVKPILENDGYAVEFIPTDANNYNSVEVVVPIKVWDVAYVAVHQGNTTLDSIVVIKGNTYALPTVSDSVGYNFIGFYVGNSKVGNSGDEIVVNENTVVEAVYEIKTFVVKFVNGDTELQSEELAYGTLPEYKGENPRKTSTVQWTYSFKGWNPGLSSVTGPVTYMAAFDSVVNKYVVTFMNGDIELQRSDVAYGMVPSAPEVSLPENTAQYTYSFGGWDKPIVAVTGAVTYYAVINQDLNKYDISFKDYDGSILKDVVQYDYGTSSTSIVKPTSPTRQKTAKYTYTFKGWSPTIADVTGNAVYIAEYDSTIRGYQIAFVNGNDELQSETVTYGEVPTYNGAVPTKQATAQWTYTFKGWAPAIGSVEGSATYTAVFDSVVNKYVVTFMNGDSELQSSEVAYGMVPSAPEVSLPENTAQYTYSFGGWDKPIVAVTGAVTYYAVINRTLNKYEISFKDYDGSILKTAVQYDYGTLSINIVKPANPTRHETAKYTYSFKGWTSTIVDVTENVVYTAVYDSTIRSYTITFVNGSKEMQSSNVAYGTTPSYKGETPTKKATAQYAYTCKGWSPAIASVSGNATYTAVFDSSVNKYTVSFINGDKILQTSSVAYGEMPKYTGETPTKASTKSYSYEFIGWSPKLGSVTKETNFVAVFDSTSITGIVNVANMSMSIHTVSRSIQISAVPVGSTYAILDMQGRVLKKGRVESSNFNILIPQAGTYFVRIGSYVQRISIK